MTDLTHSFHFQWLGQNANTLTNCGGPFLFGFIFIIVIIKNINIPP